MKDKRIKNLVWCLFAAALLCPSLPAMGEPFGEGFEQMAGQGQQAVTASSKKKTKTIFAEQTRIDGLPVYVVKNDELPDTIAGFANSSDDPNARSRNQREKKVLGIKVKEPKKYAEKDNQYLRGFPLLPRIANGEYVVVWFHKDNLQNARRSGIAERLVALGGNAPFYVTTKNNYGQIVSSFKSDPLGKLDDSVWLALIYNSPYKEKTLKLGENTAFVKDVVSCIEKSGGVITKRNAVSISYIHAQTAYFGLGGAPDGGCKINGYTLYFQ